MKHLKILIIAILLSGHLPAQTTESFEHGCNYANDHVTGLLELKKPSEKAESIVNEILAALQKQRNFELKVTNVANARATEKNGIRYILYSEKFLEEFETNALTKWAGYSLLAHEIGHHVLGHNFSASDKGTRHRQELEADDFSARALVHLNANFEEARAGIRVFADSLQSETHPGYLDRESAILNAFRNEREKLDTLLEPTGNYLALDQTGFKKNRWNLLKKAYAEIDEEKVTIKYRIPKGLPGQYYKVCLESNDVSIIPDKEGLGSVKGTGDMVQYQSEGLIVWNYKRLDSFTEREVNKAGMLRVMVYDIYKQPKPPGKVKIFSRWGFSGLGVASLGFGILEYIQGQNIYQRYKTHKDPGDPVYTDESRDERYARANRHNKLGQYLMTGGTASLGLGIFFFIDTDLHKKTYDDAVCENHSGLLLEPLVIAPLGGGHTQVGIRITF